MSEAAQPRRRSAWRWLRWIPRLIGLILLLLAGALLFVTQTDRGRGFVTEQIDTRLGAIVNGRVSVGRVLRGNLLTRAVFEHFEIEGPDGEPFVRLDSVDIRYDPISFLAGQWRFRGLTAARADIRLAMDTSGVWNFQRLFGDTLAAPPEGSAAPLVLFSDAFARSGSLEILMPWTPPPGAEGREQVRAVEDGTSMWRIEAGDDGYVQQFRLEEMRGAFPLLRVSDPGRPFRAEMRQLSGRLLAVSQPLDVQRFDGSFVLGDTARIELDRMEVGGSQLSGSGWFVPGDTLSYRFDLAAQWLAFNDLAWLPMPMPSEGGGPMELWLGSEGDGLRVAITEADVTSEDTRAFGDLDVVLGDTPRFESFDLQFQPLRLSWLNRTLGRELRGAPDGLVNGRVVGSGTVGSLQLDADVTLRDLTPGGTPSGLRVDGRVSVEDPSVLRDLQVTFEGFDLMWLEAFGVDPMLAGRLDGQATLDRSSGEPLSFLGDVSHTGPQGDVSRIEGNGRVDLEEGSVIEVDLLADPLVLSVLDRALPDLDLVGSVRGPIEARGRLGDLEATADLQTPRGRVGFTGRFDFESEIPRYDATVDVAGLSLDQWIEGAPESQLAVRGSVNGSGVDPATLDGEFDLEILPSRFERIAIDSSRVRFRVADGLAVVDTFVIETDVGVLGGRGSFGLDSVQTGPLVLEATIEDLSRLDRWLLDAETGPAEDPESLFAVDGPAPGTEETAGAAGSLHGLGAVFGNVYDFSVGGVLRADSPRWKNLAADSAVVRFDLLDPLARDSLTVTLAATNARGFSLELDSIGGSYEKAGPGPATIGAYVRRDSTVELEAEGVFALPEEDDDTYDLAFERIVARVGDARTETDRPTRIHYSSRELRIDSLSMNGSLVRLRADGSIPADIDGALAIRIQDLDLEQLVRLSTKPTDLSGSLDANLNLAGRMATPRIDAFLSLDEPRIGAHQYTSLTGVLDYADQTLRGRVELSDTTSILAVASGTVRTDLSLSPVEQRLLDDPLDLSIRADSLPLTLLELRVTGLEEIVGVADGTLTVNGSPGDLRYAGQMDVRGAGAWVPDLGVEYVSGAGSIRFEGSQATIDSFRVRSALGGEARLGGTVDISSFSDPGLDIDLAASRLLPIDRRDMTLVIDGEGQLTGRFRQPLIEGRFRLRDGDIRRDEILRSQGVLDLANPNLFGLLDSTLVADRQILERFQNPFMNNLRANVTLDLGPNLWLRAPVLDAELQATGLDVQMDRATQSTRIVGVVNVPRGTYVFDQGIGARQQLRITGGEIQFVGNPRFNPNLALTAEYRTRTPDGAVQITANIGGTLQNYELTLSSNPPMSETDQICFLAIGSPCYNAADTGFGARIQQRLLGTVSSGLASALVGTGGLGLSYFNLRTEQSGGVQSQGLFDRTEVEFGWYTGDNVFFSTAVPLGGGIPTASVEWRFSDAWTLEARSGSVLDRRFGLFRTSNLEDQRTFGLFLFREWSY